MTTVPFVSPAPTSTAKPTQTQAIPWPTRGWVVASPASQGIDPSALDHMLAELPDGYHSILIIRHSTLVFEKYFPPYDASTWQEQYSVTKSISAALIGIAIGQGKIAGPEQKVVDLLNDRKLANLDQRKLDMTLADVLTMRSGIDWPEWTDPPGPEGSNPVDAMVTQQDWIQFVLDRPMAEAPGTRWNYHTGSSHLLSAILKKATGRSPHDFGQEYLFGPLGIHDYGWQVDPDGLNIGGWGLRLTPRDMAKFGLLYLRDGLWEGRQVIPGEWVHASLHNYTDTILPGRGYGYHWWTTSFGFDANGYGGQRIFVLLDKDMVVVMTAGLLNEEMTTSPEEVMEKYILPAITSP